MPEKILIEEKFLTQLSEWLMKVGETSLSFNLPKFPDFMVANTKDSDPTCQEVARNINFRIARAEHPSYVQVYKAICGWQTMIMCWDENLDGECPGGFYDCYGTGMGPYGHTKKAYDTACREAKSWAEEEGIEDIKIPPYVKGRG